MKIHCFTNLDKLKRFSWPTELPAIPQVGDLITTLETSPKGYKVELEVVRVRWVPEKQYSGNTVWIPEIELHIPKYLEDSIVSFYKRHGFDI